MIQCTLCVPEHKKVLCTPGTSQHAPPQLLHAYVILCGLLPVHSYTPTLLYSYTPTRPTLLHAYMPPSSTARERSEEGGCLGSCSTSFTQLPIRAFELLPVPGTFRQQTCACVFCHVSFVFLSALFVLLFAVKTADLVPVAPLRRRCNGPRGGSHRQGGRQKLLIIISMNIL